MPETKRCTKCGEEKAVSEFYRRGAGFSSWCKACCAEHSSGLYKNERRYCSVCKAKKSIKLFPPQGRVCKQCLDEKYKENEKRRKREKAKEERKTKTAEKRNELKFQKIQERSGVANPQSFKAIRIMSRRCRECGVAEIYNRGNAYHLKICRKCYMDKNDYREMAEYIEDHTISKETDPPWLRDAEYERLCREFYRGKREAQKIFEPTLTCSECKKSKPLFEFRLFYVTRPDNLKDMVCEDCKLFLKNTKICPGCNERKAKECFEDEEYTYTYCSDCREERAKKRAEKIKQGLSFVDEKTLVSALNYRGLEHNEENSAIVAELLLAKRINRELCSIMYQKKYQKQQQEESR